MVTTQAAPAHNAPMDLETFSLLVQHLGVKFSAEQWQVIADHHLYKLVTGGVRAGKSFLSALYLVLRMVHTIYARTAMPGDVYWLIAKTYKLTSEEFKYAKGFLQKIGFLGFATSQADAPGRIELNVCPCGLERCGHDRISIQCKTAMDEEAIAAQAPRGIVICEAGQITLEQYWRIEERLLQHAGWLLMAGTMEFNVGWYADRSDLWQIPEMQKRDDAASFRLPSYSNLFDFPGGRNDPKIKRFEAMHPRDWFENRIEAKRIKPQGVVFPEFNTDIHVKPLKYEPGHPVYVCADPGYSRITESAYAVEFFQRINGQIRVFDEIYVQEHGARQVAAIAKRKPWWHEAEKIGVIDQGGKQHHTGESHVDIWLEETGLIMESSQVGLLDGIDRLREILMPDPVYHQPAIVFDAKCQGVLSEMGGALNPFTMKEQIYMWPRDSAGEVRGRVPVDKYNHGVKAITYGIVNQFGYGEKLGELAAAIQPVRGRGVEVKYW